MLLQQVMMTMMMMLFQFHFHFSQHMYLYHNCTTPVIAHEEIAAADPAFCLSFLAHSMLFVNNLNQNGTPEQVLLIEYHRVSFSIVSFQ